MTPQVLDFDQNATTSLAPEVAHVMAEAYGQHYANPESQHTAGRRARRVLEDAREELGHRLGADLTSRQPDRLLVSSGGTEANNLALFGLAARVPPPARVVVSSIEHPSVARAADELVRRGYAVERIPVDAQGLVQVDRLDLADPRPAVVSLMRVNNETGVIQPVEELAGWCRNAGVPLHCDAVQALGKIPLTFRELGVDAMSVTAHKLHGPRGVGALVLRHGIEPRPLFWGGVQQLGLRPGTEDVALALGFLKAVEIWQREQVEVLSRFMSLHARFEQTLRAGWPELVIHGQEAPRVGNTTCASFVGLDRQQLFMALDLAGVACSTGSACASGSSDPSPTLVAMHRPEAEIRSALRFSFGRATTAADIDGAAERILKTANQLRLQKSSTKMASAHRETA